MQIPGGAPGVAEMMELIAQDKKVERGKLNFILLRGIGQAFIARDIAGEEVARFLEERLVRG
jgi:3-dehydroquinate synthetase